jgi:hypothetical protein
MNGSGAHLFPSLGAIKSGRTDMPAKRAMLTGHSVWTLAPSFQHPKTNGLIRSFEFTRAAICRAKRCLGAHANDFAVAVHLA